MDRQLARFLTSQDTVDITASAPELIKHIRAIRDDAATRRKPSIWVNSRDFVPGGGRHNDGPMRVVNGSGPTIGPPTGASRANAAILGSISSRLRTANNSTPIDPADLWMAGRKTVPPAVVICGLNSTVILREHQAKSFIDSKEGNAFSEFPMRTPEYLRKQAEKCRRLASQVTNTPVADQLNSLAAEYEAEAQSVGNELQMQAGNEPDDEQGQQQQS